MDFKVILQPLALDDLEGIVRYIAEKDLQAANRLGMSLLDRAEALAQFQNAAAMFGAGPE
jgi:plasmid stabilization system protein ParE